MIINVKNLNFLLSLKVKRVYALFIVACFSSVVAIWTISNKHLFYNGLYAENVSIIQSTDEVTEFASNELLIKVKKEVKDKIKGDNPLDTGIDSLNKKSLLHNVAKIEKVNRENKHSNANADIFLWYKITFKGNAKKLTGKFDKKTNQLIAENLELKNFADIINDYKKDPNIQAVEPNFVVKIVQSDTPTSVPTSTSFMNITYPNGGEIFTIGDPIRITWNTSILDPTIGCNLTYVTEETGPTWYYNIGYPKAVTGFFDWNAQIPVGSVGPQKLMVYIICAGAPEDRSDNFFTVTSVSTTPTLTPTSAPIPTPNPSANPNDPYYFSTGSWGQTYPDLWGIKKINSGSAWDMTKGSSTVIVADIDTGVDRNHEDLRDNMWVNTGEIPNNGIDDDANGYIDDYYGWDFVNNDGDPIDDNGHGTHTVGTIAGVGNNGIGIVGINWTSRIIAVKFLDYGGSGTLENGAKALQYAADMGAKISSNSWTCNCQSGLTDDAVKYEHDKGMLSVVAAGNSNSDALNFSPASSHYSLTVAASDPNDAKASFSNWGEKIDAIAPGVDILSARAALATICGSTTVGTNYCRLSGTSMATPHVAGLAALILSKNPTLSNEDVRQIIRSNADDLGALGRDIYFGYGRINSATALANATNKPPSVIISSPTARTAVSGATLSVYGVASGTNFASYRLESGSGRTPISWTTIINSTTPVSNGLLATVDTSSQMTTGLNILKLTVTDTAGKEYQFEAFDINVILPTPTSTLIPTVTPTPTATPSPTLTPTPTAIPTPTPTPDITPPVVNINSPINGGMVPKNTIITISANASDPSGVSKVEFYIDNVLTCTDLTVTYTCSWKIPVKKGVKYTIQARAYDKQGNIGSTSISVTSK